ncbi:MFS transporter [Pseudohalioglobus sediminis]|uniref:MFS transporter n=1 Tax=Pseudohalioglobus sediminis TaxID=2606449 RepID=A0A5B0X4R7_9GAMM|nr:MFS transporter [Pseudohalioglobus sediminis]KAA1194334.1 MFS transporter [Pseudohalioglobus sediminis]
MHSTDDPRVIEAVVHDVQRLPALVAMLPVAMMGAAVLTLLPLWVGTLSEGLGFTQQQVGFLASADMVGIFITSTSAVLWVRHWPWRWVVLLGLTLFLIGNVGSMYSRDFAHLYGLRVVAGLGCGAAYAVALAALGDTRNPDWSFGLMVTAQVAFGFIGFEVLPGLIEAQGLNAFFLYLNAWLILALLLSAVLFPRAGAPVRDGVALRFRDIGGLAGAAFFGTVILYIAISAVWGYMERMGVGAELASSRVSEIIGWGYLISILGSIAAPAVSQKVGRTAAMLLALVVMLCTFAGLGMMEQGNALWTYIASTVVFQFFWSFVLPPLMATFNAVDESGRFIVLCSPAFKIGEIIGPPMAAFWIVDSQYQPVLWLGGVCAVIGIGLLVLVDQRARVAT